MARRGRPRGFSREQALERALDLFWRSATRERRFRSCKTWVGLRPQASMPPSAPRRSSSRSSRALHQDSRRPMITALTQGATARASVEASCELPSLYSSSATAPAVPDRIVRHQLHARQSRACRSICASSARSVRRHSPAA